MKARPRTAGRESADPTDEEVRREFLFAWDPLWSPGRACLLLLFPLVFLGHVLLTEAGTPRIVFASLFAGAMLFVLFGSRWTRRLARCSPAEDLRRRIRRTWTRNRWASFSALVLGTMFAVLTAALFGMKCWIWVFGSGEFPVDLDFLAFPVVVAWFLATHVMLGRHLIPRLEATLRRWGDLTPHK